MTEKAEGASRKTINLALQGGGAHGAYTWGVLDALLEDGRIAFDAISGASAGAMNAVAFAEGFIDKGPDGARQKLHDFWLSVSQEGALTPVQRKLFDVWFGGFAFSASPAYYWVRADAVTTFAEVPTSSIRSISILCATISSGRSTSRKSERATR